MTGAPIGDALRQIGRLFSGGTAAGQSDAVLLRRFVAGGDEEAFAGLVAWHGPMVLAVCRGLLRDPSDAEDAFQATFLVLVRRAGSIWVDESLGGWLYRVAHRVARRAYADAAKRRARERQGVEMDMIAGRDHPADRPGSELHAEIARLPEAMRRALVLCDLEGITQVEAARLLRCGEATLRRRLAGARERLRVRLARRGMAPSAVATLAKAPPVPTAWAEATIRAAVAGASGRVATSAGRLASAVVDTMIRTRRLQVGALFAGIVLAAWTVEAARRDQPGDVAIPRATPAKAGREGAPQAHWVHRKSDVGSEGWICLDDGREFWKFMDSFGLRDPVTNNSRIYSGRGSIVGLRDPVTNNSRFYSGRGPIVREVHALWDEGNKPLSKSVFLIRAGVELPDGERLTPGRADVAERETAPEFSDREIETLGGRRCLRIDLYRREGPGEARLEEQTWVDLETRRPIRRRVRLGPLAPGESGPEFGTTTYEDMASGPADLFALGVPAGTPEIDEATTRDPKLKELPKDLQHVIRGAAEAIGRFPLDFRAVVEDGYLLELIYWSSPEASMRDTVDDMVGKFVLLIRSPPIRSFYAERHDVEAVPRDLRPAPGADPTADFPADRLAAWFAVEKAGRIELNDGARTFELKRFSDEHGPPRPARLSVHRGMPGFLPRPLQALWPFVYFGSGLSVVEPEPGTPEGQIAIREEVEGNRYVWYCDPARDFIAARQLTWTKQDGDWKLARDERAVRWKRLPGGSWYVAAWEVRLGDMFRPADKGPAAKAEDRPTYRRVEITPLDPGGFPPGVFGSDKFLESARKEGAKIEVPGRNKRDAAF